MDSTAEFDKDEMELLATAMREQAAADAAMVSEAEEADGGEAGQDQQTDAAATPAPAPAQAVAAPAPAPAAVEPGHVQQQPAPQPAQAASPAAPAQAPAPAPATSQPEGGNARGALRAVRREARQLRADLEKAKTELEETRKLVQPPVAKGKRPSDDVMRDVEAYAAPAAEYIAELERATAELSARVESTTGTKPGEPVFTPEYIPDAELQEVVDSIDELSDWQNSAQHAKLWDAAKKMDALLVQMPAWTGKPDKDRLEEAVRRVKQDFTGAQKAPATANDAKRVIDAIPAATAPVTIGDMRGGNTPSHSTIPDFRQMVREGLSDEEIMASLEP